jgi:hypothetical protein
MDEDLQNDLIWLKEELELLTKEQRCIILEKYNESIKDFSISIEEYNLIVNLFNDLD